MNKSKGMSQILVLIVAAAVLMMVGLLLISISSGSITDTFSQTSAGACNQQISSQCDSGISSDGDSLPSSCDGVPEDDISYSDSDGNIDCP